jgi:hypothetical protein
MHFAGNFHPEWGYLAPAPSLMRTARVAMVAMAVGATAGAGVVLSLVDRPAETSVAARTLVRPVEVAASTLVSASEAAQAQPQRQVNMQAAIQGEAAKPVPAGVRVSAPAASESSTVPAAQAPANVAALAEAPAATATAPVTPAAEPTPGPGAVPAADAAPAPKKAKSKHHPSHYASRGGPLELLPGEYYANGASGWPRDGRWGGYFSDNRYSDR